MCHTLTWHSGVWGLELLPSGIAFLQYYLKRDGGKPTSKGSVNTQKLTYELLQSNRDVFLRLSKYLKPQGKTPHLWCGSTPPPAALCKANPPQALPSLSRQHLQVKPCWSQTALSWSAESLPLASTLVAHELFSVKRGLGNIIWDQLTGQTPSESSALRVRSSLLQEGCC